MNNIDLTANTVTFQKPGIMDTPIYYQKPNAYDEEPPVIITASRHGSKSSKMTVDSFASRYFQKREQPIILPVSVTPNDTGYYYSPNTPVESPPLSPKSPITTISKNQIITSFILSQSNPTTETCLGHHSHNTPLSYYALPSSPANSIMSNTTIHHASTVATATNVVAATAALLSSNDGGTVSSFFLQQQQHKRHNSKPITNNNTIVYNIKKASILKPNQHHIFLHIDHLEEDDEELMIYRKIQPFSYTWGFQSMLYCNKNDGQGIKVAESRRRAFQKDIIIESADYNNSEINDITQPHINNLKNIPASNNIHSQDLIKRSQSNILFEYEIWFNGSRMRWKRPSLLSHNFTCEIKLTRQETKLHYQQLKKKKSVRSNNKTKNNNRNNRKDDDTGGFIDSDSDNDEDDHDNHTHKSCRRWKLIAEFDSYNMSYLNKEYGKLSIDLDILNQVEKERCDLLEANIVMTCCTLIDLIRDVLGK